MMRRILEIIANVRDKYPNDDFFSNFEYSCRISPLKRQYYRAYNNALNILDIESWQVLKEKALQQYLNHRKGQKKQGFFNQLNEAFAYRYLIRKGFDDVKFIREGKNKTPDIGFKVHNTQSYCEVKTLGISDDEINRRTTWTSSKVNDCSLYESLNDGFVNKFYDAVNAARQQICSVGSDGLVYIIIRFDDIALDNYQDYRRRLISFCKMHRFDNLFIKMGLFGNLRICITSHYK